MFQKTKKQFKVLARSIAMVGLAFSLISTIGGGVNVQSAPVCPTGSTLIASQCEIRTPQATYTKLNKYLNITNVRAPGDPEAFVSTSNTSAGNVSYNYSVELIPGNTLTFRVCRQNPGYVSRFTLRVWDSTAQTDPGCAKIGPADASAVWGDYTQVGPWANTDNLSYNVVVSPTASVEVHYRGYWYSSATYAEDCTSIGGYCNSADDATGSNRKYTANFGTASFGCPDTSWTTSGKDCIKTVPSSSYSVDNASMGAGSCNPNPTTQGKNVTCTFPLTGSSNGVYVLPPEGVFAVVRNINGDAGTGLGNSSLCTVSGATLTCTNVPVPQNTTIGVHEVVGHRPLVEWMPNKAQLQVTSMAIDNSNVGVGNCGNSNTVTQGTTIACTFPLTGSGNGTYVLPQAGLYGGVLKINGVVTDSSNVFGPSNPCTVSGSALTCTGIPVSSDATLGSHEVVILEPTVQWMRNKGSVNVIAPTVVPTATEITQVNTGTGTCNPAEVAIGTSTVCSYPLTGNSTNSYKLPTTSITTKVSTVSTSSDSCQIFNNGTVNVSLVCSNVPTTGGTIGNQTAMLNLTGETNSAPIKLNPSSATTVISADNTGTGKCTPSTITIGNLTLCDFPLSGGVMNNYSLPISGIKAQISTANSLSTPCQISNNGTAQASLTCTQVPTSGAKAGSQSAKLNLANETSTAPVTLLAAVTTLGVNPTGELGGKAGSPVTGYISTTGSTYSGPATYTNGTNCTISGVMSLGIFTPVQGATVPMDCPLGALSNGVIKATGNVDLTGVKSNFAKSELNIDDIKKIDVVCNSGKAVTVNSATTCAFELPSNKTLPKELFFGIGDSKPAGTCTLKDKTVTCINIPTGSKSGIQPLNSQINGGAIFDTGKKITVIPATVLVKTGSNAGILFGLLAFVAASFSLTMTSSLQLAKQRK